MKIGLYGDLTLRKQFDLRGISGYTNSEQQLITYSDSTQDSQYISSSMSYT